MEQTTEISKTERQNGRQPEQKEREAAVTDFYTLFLDVVRQWWVILIVGISVAFLSYIIASFLYQPKYVSQTTFVVSARGSNTGAYANLSQTQQMAEVFKRYWTVRC